MDDGTTSLLVVILLSLFMVFLNFVFVARIFFNKGKTYPSFSVGGHDKPRGKNIRQGYAD